ncbi:unnamed protein product, partial [Pylaiella littoralis]
MNGYNGHTGYYSVHDSHAAFVWLHRPYGSERRYDTQNHNFTCTCSTAGRRQGQQPCPPNSNYRTEANAQQCSPSRHAVLVYNRCRCSSSRSSTLQAAALTPATMSDAYPGVASKNKRPPAGSHRQKKHHSTAGAATQIGHAQLTQGMGVFCTTFLVSSLNFLQNSIMLMPR